MRTYILSLIFMFVFLLFGAMYASGQSTFERRDYSRQKQEQERMKYNPHEKTWSYEKKDSRMRYNPHEKKWSYTEKDERMRYNPHSRKWEWAK